MSMKKNRFKSFISRAELLNKSYKIKARVLDNSTTLFMASKPKVVTSFNQPIDINNIQLPLVVSGTLISAGEYFEPAIGEEAILSMEELTATVGQWNVDLMKSHGATASLFNGENIGIDHITGRINRVVADEESQSLLWEGIVADIDIARKVALGLIKFVSITFKNTLEEIEGRFHYTEIQPLDVSLVFNPRDRGASIKAGTL